MNTGEIIKAYRDKMELTQESVAKFLGIKREVLSYYENNTREIPLNQLEKLSNLFGIELDEFFEENENLVNTNVACAFRASEIKQDDLQSISEFKKIVKNYFKILNLEKDCENRL
jgi:transcriptional regulator with XRE-family HTH domain